MPRKRTTSALPGRQADAEAEVTPLSKTRLKQQMHELQALGKRLIPLGADRLASLPLDDRLRDAIIDAGRISDHEGLRRQLQFIGKLMRGADADAIRAALDADSQVTRAQTSLLHACERWRESLLEDPSALARFVALYRPVDNLGALVEAARLERSRGQAPAAYRRLFRAIHRCLAPTPAGSPGDPSGAAETDGGSA